MNHPLLEHAGKILPRSLRWWVVTALLACHCLLAITSVLGKSNTVDELNHLSAGYDYWTRGDFRLNPENGNLPQRWAALPLLFQDIHVSESKGGMDEEIWLAAQTFFFELGNNADQMLFSGRVMMIGLSLILGLMIFLWSEKIFGLSGALISLTLFAFSPTLLVHGRLTTSDTASALFFLVAIRSLWALMHRVDRSAILWSGIATAGLILSKMSGALIVPMVLVMALVRLFGGTARPLRLGRGGRIESRWKQTAVILAACLAAASICAVIVWGCYGFRFSAAPDLYVQTQLSFPRWDEQLAGTGAVAPAIRFCRDHRLLPEAYLYGVSHVFKYARQRPAFMNGRYSETGWWQFFPFCFAVKTPLGVFALLLLALAAVAGRQRRCFLYDLWPLVILIGIYGAVAISSNINIGHRHILPVYPALFVFAGAGGRWFAHRFMVVRLVPVLALAVFIAESLTIWPHYLAFFNASAGGPALGYRRLVDSSLDWGQDLPGLRRWIDARNRGEDRHRPVYLAYFGTASPAYHRLAVRIISLRTLPWMRQWRRFATTLEPGDYCISATELQQVYGFAGGWKPEYERAYDMARRLDENLLAKGDESQARTRLTAVWVGREKIGYVLGPFRRLQFARLCAALKQREPDAQVGYSILIYHVSPGELHRALNGPPESWGMALSDPEG